MSTPLELLASIDATLKALLALQRGAQPKDTASDTDLDGQFGDPEIKAKDPRDWTGPSQKGKFMSQCPAPYLDLIASRLDFFAEKAEAENTLTTSGKPVAPYNRRDAARARGWAARIRAGWKPPEPERESDPFASGGDITAAQIPFGTGPVSAVGDVADEDTIPF